MQENPVGVGGKPATEPECGDRTFTVSMVSASGAACAGGRLTFALEVEGGSAPYEWRLVAPGDATFDMREQLGATVEWPLRASGEQQLTVEVTDDCDRVARWSKEVLVREPPVVVTRELAPVCEGEVVHAELEARGGDAATYAWNVGGLPEIGLGVEESSLVGHLRLREARESIPLTLSVSDGSCSSAVVEVSLPIAAGSSAECPQIRVEGALDDRLPPPCSGHEYRAAFILVGASGWAWRAESLPAMWEFDPATQLVRGTPQGPDGVVVEVTDSRGRRLRKAYSFEPREKCWLGYLAAPGAPARLHLIDPVLEPFFDTRRVLPSDAGDDPVLDFQFSPDGRFLAYRVGAEADGPRLVLVRLSDWREWSIDSFDAVREYAWASDSRVLAVAGTLEGVTQLGGVDVSTASASAAEPRILSPRAASVDSRLTWFATRFVAFHAAHPAVPVLRQVHFAGLDAAGFEAPVTPGGVIYPTDLQLRPSPSGIFIATPATGDEDFVPVDGPATRQTDVIVSPAGSLKARVVNGELQFFAPEDSNGAPPRATVPGCDRLLAWAANERWIACEVERSGRNSLVMVDVPASRQGVPATLDVRELPRSEEYPTGAHVERRRLFSATGRWFAFELDGSGYVVAVDDGTPRVTRAWPDLTQQPLGNFAQLEFSPDERQLLEHAGSQLIYHHLEDNIGGRSYTVVENAMLPPDACSEDFLAAESNWCGARAEASAFVWSPDSSRIAFVTASGHLRIRDFSFSYGGQWPDTLEVDPTCGTGCLPPGSFMFQP